MYVSVDPDDTSSQIQIEDAETLSAPRITVPADSDIYLNYKFISKLNKESDNADWVVFDSVNDDHLREKSGLPVTSTAASANEKATEEQLSNELSVSFDITVDPELYRTVKDIVGNYNHVNATGKLIGGEKGKQTCRIV